jgi:hypothetical protein
MRRVRLPGPIRLDFEPLQHRGSFAVTPAPSRYKDSAVGLETGVQLCLSCYYGLYLNVKLMYGT